MKIRVGIVGAGANTRLRHIPGLQAIEEVEIVSVANRTIESARRVAREFGIPKVFDHWEDLVMARDLDAVVIGTWPNLHCAVTLAALDAGKHVLCEARMARNAKEARAMWQAARCHPRQIAQLVPAPFTLRVDRTVQRLIAEGFVGDVLAVEVRAGGPFLDRDAPLHWRQDAELSGLNMMSLGIWYESVLRWVGPATRVLAMGRVFVNRRRDAAGEERAVRIPEHLDAVAELRRGGQLHLLISNVAGLAGAPEIFVFGSDGTLRFCQDKLHGGRRGDQQLREIDPPRHEQVGWRVEEEFIHAIRGQEPVRLTTFEDGVRYMDFTDAVARSLETGAAVKLPA
jgi:predicted dehydrogenase